MIFLFKWGPLSCDLCLTSAPACTHLPTFFSHTSMTITRYWGLIKVDEWHEQHFKEAINQQAQTLSSLQLSWQRPTPPLPIKKKNHRSHFNYWWGQTGGKEVKRATLHPYIELILNGNHKNIGYWTCTLCQTVKHAHCQVKATITRQLQQIQRVGQRAWSWGQAHVMFMSDKGGIDWGVLLRCHGVKTTQLKLLLYFQVQLNLLLCN